MFYKVLLAVLCTIQVQGADDQNCERQIPLTSPKTGRKAWDKCIEYQQLLYPCKKGAKQKLTSTNPCSGNDDDDFVRHFALLGKEADSLNWRNQWLCGGTLISDKFILTAGRCMVWNYSGYLKLVVLGTLRRSDADLNISNRYKIKETFYPKGFDTNFYHYDIGLVETEEKMKLSQFIVPACLHIGDSVEDNTAYSIGWGSSKEWTSTNDELKKITLKKSTIEECSLKYPSSDFNEHAMVDEAFQLCYKNKETPDNDCMSTSGSPLQIKNKNLSCMYTVIGVTSENHGCVYGAPGLYSRVSYYLSWIESIVWP